MPCAETIVDALATVSNKRAELAGNFEAKLLREIEFFAKCYHSDVLEGCRVDGALGDRHYVAYRIFGYPPG